VGYPISNKVATIGAGASLSNQFYVGAGEVCGILMPAAWTAAVITFRGSVDGVNFYDLYDQSGVEVAITVAAATIVSEIANVRDMSRGLLFMKVRSGTSAVPVNQVVAAVLSVQVFKAPMYGGQG
jgi:hypothetical protein